jgi:membrane protease YdiL (CAAX protease family)
MQKPGTSRMQVATYLALVLLFSSFFYFFILRAHTLSAGSSLYTFGLMWSPGLAAIAILKLNGRPLSELGWKWPAVRYAAMSWYVPLIYAVITYGIVWSLGFGGFPNYEFMNVLVARMGLRASPMISTVVYVLIVGSIGLVRGMASVLGEEIGWRGFLVPELFKTTNFTATALITGLVWALWHYPALIWTDYNGGTPAWYGLTCFTILVFAASFIFAWIRLKSGSLWTGAILHASHNLYIQAILTPLTRNTGKTAWFIDEFGAVLPLVVLMFAIYFWRRRREIETPEADHLPVAAIGAT